MWLNSTNILADYGFIEAAGFEFQPDLSGVVFALPRRKLGVVAVKSASRVQGLFHFSGDKGPLTVRLHSRVEASCQPSLQSSHHTAGIAGSHKARLNRLEDLMKTRNGLLNFTLWGCRLNWRIAHAFASPTDVSYKATLWSKLKGGFHFVDMTESDVADNISSCVST